MDLKVIEKIKIISNKRTFKKEVEEAKKMNVEVYCIVCQTYGHIVSEECVVRAMCFDCGFKGHLRRYYCKEERREFKHHIKIEEVKTESSNCDTESEYVEEEIPKDEPTYVTLESDSVVTEIGKDMITPLIMCKEYIKEDIKDVKDKKNSEFEVYCILCQIHGHRISEACVVNVICLVCGIKGHVRRDCKEEKCELKNVKLEVKNEGTKYEEEYVEVEIDKHEPKTEVQLKSDSEIPKVGEDMITSLSMSEENKESDFSMNLVGENGKWTHLKKCSVNLLKLNIKESTGKGRNSRRDGKRRRQEGNYWADCEAFREGMKYPCTQCDYKATYPSDIKVHVKSIHKGVKHPCTQCDYKATHLSNLKVHIKSVHKREKYPCIQCDHKATKLSNLKVHIKSVHEGVKFPCDQCDYKATQLSSLSCHIKAVHKGVKFPCTQCDYKATHLRGLNVHVKSIHEGVKYQCTQCDYKATQLSNLKVHIKSIHEGVKYPCTQCDYKATRLDSLTRHIKAIHFMKE